MTQNTSDQPQPSPEEKRKAEIEAVAAELIAMIQAGTAPWQKPWTPATGSDMPFNHISGEAYHGFNALKLWICGRDDPRWMTYKQAQETGAQVRKGERGVGLLRVITHEVRAKRDENGNIVKDQNGETVQERVWLERPIFKAFTVFNAEQIDGLPEYQPQPLPELTWDDHSRAERILAASGADILHKAGDAAYYRPSADIIVLPAKNQFAAAGDYYATALHELGHWTGHESRLNRDLSGGFGSESYAREELRAEIASMMMSRVLGIPHHPERHASYVENWIKILQNDPEEILRATTDAGHIRSYLLDFAPEIRQETEPEPIRETTPTADTAVFLRHQETQPAPDKETAMKNPSREPDSKPTALLDALHQAADHARQNGTDTAYIKQLADTFAEQHHIPHQTGERFTVQTLLFTVAAEAAEKGSADADWLETMARAYARDFGEGFAPVEAGVRPLPDADASLSDVLQMAVDDTLQRDRADARYLEQLSDTFAEHNHIPPDSEPRLVLNYLLIQTAADAQWDREIDAGLVRQTAMIFEERFGSFRQSEALSHKQPQTAESLGNTPNTLPDDIQHILDEHQLWLQTNGRQGAQADLSHKDLSGANLSNINLSHAKLNGANLAYISGTDSNFQQAKLDEANLTGAYLVGADLSHASLNKAVLNSANLTGTDLQYASMTEADLHTAQLDDANLFNANLTGANLHHTWLIDAKLIGTNLMNADLSQASMYKAFLSHVNLQGANVRSAYFAESDIRHIDLRGLDLRGTDFDSARFLQANLASVDLRETNLRGSRVEASNLSGAHLNHSDLRGARFLDVDLNSADLSEANLSGAYINAGQWQNTKLSGADLSSMNSYLAHFNGADLQNADLSKANLTNAYFNSADLRGADLSGANLSAAKFNHANLQNAKLCAAKAANADFTAADLSGADMNGIDVSRARLEHADLRGVDLHNIQFLDTATRSGIRLDTTPATQTEPSGQTETAAQPAQAALFDDYDMDR